MDAMQQHLQRHTFKGSALSDQLLANLAIYPDVHCELPDTTSSAHEVGDVGAPLGVASKKLSHSPKLSLEQANFFMRKIINTFEADTSAIPMDGKAKCRIEHADLWAARQTMQWWEPVGRQTAQDGLSSEDFADIEFSVMHSSILDQEVASMMQRRPPIFYLEMLPSLASSQRREEASALAAPRQKLCRVAPAQRSGERFAELSIRANDSGSRCRDGTAD